MPLKPEDAIELARFREWLLGFLPEEGQQKYEDLSVKLAIINTYLTQTEDVTVSEGNLIALGACLGDALAQDVGLDWVSVTDEDGEYIALNRDKTSLVVNPLPMLLHRVQAGATLDIYSMFVDLSSRLKELTHEVD